MADPTAKTFSQIVQGQAAAIQARATALIDFEVGSVLRAAVEAVAGVVTWLQALILKLATTIRASSSQGSDLDSWFADFGAPIADGAAATFERLGATYAIGDLTFTRLTPTGTSLIPVGSTAETPNGADKFVVLLDASNSAYDAGLNGYLMEDGDATITVPAQALVAGSAGNVTAGTINTITSSIPGVDLVTNAADFVNGSDQESDENARARFRSFIQGLREATPAAIQSYVEALQPGVKTILVENEEYNGVAKRGSFYLIVDDGTGTPPSDLLEAASASVDQHRAAGIEGAVYPPEVVTANISMTVTVAAGASSPATFTAVQAAVRSYVNTRALGEDLAANRLYQIAYDASPNVIGVTNLLVNGVAGDIVIERKEVIKAGTVVIS
jgi:uncharacterized phage protein gp47/JayE